MCCIFVTNYHIDSSSWYNHYSRHIWHRVKNRTSDKLFKGQKMCSKVLDCLLHRICPIFLLKMFLKLLNLLVLVLFSKFHIHDFSSVINEGKICEIWVKWIIQSIARKIEHLLHIFDPLFWYFLSFFVYIWLPSIIEQYSYTSIVKK